LEADELGEDSGVADEAPGWLTQPLSLGDALSVALEGNADILASQKDIEATHGTIIQTKAISLPTLGVRGDYSFNNGTEELALIPGQPAASFQQENNWNVGIRLTQSIYEGGRMRSAYRTARYLEEQALQRHRTVINNTVLEVRTAYLDTLLAAEQITVNEKSVSLLEKELEDTRRRYEAGTVPKFNVLRAEVSLANARPNLSRARNAWRISKNNLATLMGYDLPNSVWDNIPLYLTGTLERQPFSIDLPTALTRATGRTPTKNTTTQKNPTASPEKKKTKQ
jgi:outer membrane protein TolC